MRYFLLISVICTSLFSSLAFSRSPAVLDFVGIEHKTFKYQRIPSGATATYNFEQKDYSSYQKAQFTPEPTNYFTFSTFISLLFVLCLPFATWLTIKIKTDNRLVESKQAGIEIISKYREAKKLAEESSNDDDDQISKAS